MKRHRASAFSLVELLLASLIFAITIAGALSIWAAATTSIIRTNEESIAAQIVRADLEKAKGMGFDYLTKGTLTGGVGTYTGTTPTSTNVCEYYTQAGAFNGYGTAAAPPATAYYRLARVTTDTNVSQGAGTSYALLSDSLRTVVSTVTRISDSSVVYKMGIKLVKGGI